MRYFKSLPSCWLWLLDSVPGYSTHMWLHVLTEESTGLPAAGSQKAWDALQLDSQAAVRGQHGG